MRVTGIDIGADAIAVVTLTNSALTDVFTLQRSKTRTIKGRRVRVFDTNYPTRLRKIAEGLAARRPCFVYVEQGYVKMGNVKSYRALAYVEAEVQYEFMRAGAQVKFVKPSEWQSMFLKGKKREELEESSLLHAKRWVKTNGCECAPPSTIHECDALGIALYGDLHAQSDSISL